MQTQIQIEIHLKMGLQDKIQDAKTQLLVINKSIKQFRLIHMQKHKHKYENTSMYVVLRLSTSVTKSHLQAKVTTEHWPVLATRCKNTDSDSKNEICKQRVKLWMEKGRLRKRCKNTCISLDPFNTTFYFTNQSICAALFLLPIQKALKRPPGSTLYSSELSSSHPLILSASALGARECLGRATASSCSVFTF